MLVHNKSSRYLLWIALVTISMSLAMAVMLILQLNQRKAIHQSSYLGNDSITAMAFQFEREFLRFRQELGNLITGHPPPDMDDVRLRLDIFVSRLGLLRDNPSIALLQARPEYAAVIPNMEQLVARTDSLLGVDKLDTYALERLQEDFNAIGSGVQALSMAANSQVSSQLERQSIALLRQIDLIVWLTLAQLIVLLLTSGALVVRHRKQEQEHVALKKLTDNLIEANLQAESANRGKSQFLANMSHELRTPFNGMLGMLGLLEGTPLNSQQADYVSTVRGSASHLLALLNDILDVSALDVGKMAIHLAPVQLANVLHDVEALMRPLALEKKLGFSVVVHNTLPPWVQADSTRMKQILLNLISNSIKFSAEGHIFLDVECDFGKASNAVNTVALRLCIRDQGIGMDAETLACLFQRFSQGDSSISRRFGGTGLGLEISRNLARLMGGDITVQSEPGQGSQFSFELTLSCTTAPTPAEPASESINSQNNSLNIGFIQGLDIVVAEDHPINRKYMQGLLSQLGHSIRFVENGEQAVTEIRRHVPDLVFMDVHMPIMDGLLATKELRAGGGAAAGVYIVALTADAFAESRERALSAGMDAFLSKPVGVDQIETLLLQRFGMRGIVPTQSSVITEPTLVSPTSKPAVLAASKSARKRFRSGDAALHLDMAMLGEVCVAVSLSGYSALLDSFLSDESHSFYKLATALDNCDVHALQESAHAFKGAAASIGLHALATLAAHIEHSGHGYVPDECAENAQKLHTLFETAHALCHRMGLTGLAAKEC